MVTRQPLGRINEEALGSLRKEHIAAFPEAHEEMIAYGVASEVLIHLIGPQWWARTLAGSNSDPYFAKDAEDPPSRFLHQHRVIALAEHLLECQDLSEFDAMIADLRSRSLLGAANEIGAVHRFLSSGHTVEFVERSGIRGRDFDFLVDGDIAVEVKAKEDSAKYSRSSLDGTIAQARRQLPSSGPCVVVLRIPDAWATNPEFVADAHGVIASKLRNSRRINAIVVTWEEWLSSQPPGQMLCVVRFRTFVNADPRTPIPNVDRVIRGFEHFIADALRAAPAAD